MDINTFATLVFEETPIKEYTVEEIASRLSVALAEKALYLVYQPMIDIRTNEVYAAEALLRWRDKELGLVPPGKFIPVAQQFGMVRDIDDWVLKRSCLQCQAFHEQGAKNLRMSVNLSMQPDTSDDYVDYIHKCLIGSGLAPEYLVIEIPVYYLREYASTTCSIIHRLKELGVYVLLDAFSADYVDLISIPDLPIDGIKVDRKTIENIANDPSSVSIFKGIKALSERLKVDLIAIGVENIDQLDVLQQNQCHVIQGFMLSEPVSPKLLSGFLSKKS